MDLNYKTKEEIDAYIEEALKNGSTIRMSDIAYADDVNVREKMAMPELDLEKFGRPSENAYETCCGNCCWFINEDAYGEGVCAETDDDGCSMTATMCNFEVCKKYVSRREMRHHMAVLLQYHRADEGMNYRFPGGDALEEAVVFAYRYMKVFSEL